jgi:hypothetical protein
MRYGKDGKEATPPTPVISGVIGGGVLVSADG